MKKKISILFAATAIIAVMAVNFQVNENSNVLSDINLKVLAQNALAEEEGGPGGVGDCPGGSCTYSNSFGDNCSACCPEGKDPHCDQFGCECR